MWENIMICFMMGLLSLTRHFLGLNCRMTEISTYWFDLIVVQLLSLNQSYFRLRQQTARVMDPSLLKTKNLHEVKHWIEPGKYFGFVVNYHLFAKST